MTDLDSLLMRVSRCGFPIRVEKSCPPPAVRAFWWATILRHRAELIEKAGVPKDHPIFWGNYVLFLKPALFPGN